jgi:surface antigen Omp85-like protein
MKAHRAAIPAVFLAVSLAAFASAAEIQPNFGGSSEPPQEPIVVSTAPEAAPIKRDHKISIVHPMEPIVVSTVAPSAAGRINRQIPPNAEYSATDASLKKSAVTPGYSIIPLPAFQYDRNEGAWVGALAPIFRTNAKGQVEDIIAPLYLHNDRIGETFALNMYSYRDETRQYHAVISHATKIEHLLDVGYKDTGYDDGRYIIILQANSGKTAFERFYGFGNGAPASAESNYTKGDTEIKVSGGINLDSSFSVLATERVRRVKIEDGAANVTQTLYAFPTAPGIDGADIWSQGVTLAYDTRDNQLTPLDGVYATLTGESDQNYKTDNRDQWWRATADYRSYYPHDDDQAVLVSRAMFDDLPIDSKGLVRQGVPFYERPTLGGEDTLRAFGNGRFVSSYSMLINVEERISLVQRSIMGNVIEIEVAPFLDVGRVGPRITSRTLTKNVQVDPGIGLRLLARPNIASRLDVGYGRDGANIFVGLDYPF